MAVGGFCCSFNFPIPIERMYLLIKHNKNEFACINYHYRLKKNWLRTNTFGLKGGLSFAFKIDPNEDHFYKITYADTLRVLWFNKLIRV